MPTIALFFGFVIQMYWRDHAPPHIHVFYQGFEALMSIETGDIIAGRLPPAATRMVADWVAKHRDDLRANWAKAVALEPLERVPGADVE